MKPIRLLYSNPPILRSRKSFWALISLTGLAVLLQISCAKKSTTSSLDILINPNALSFSAQQDGISPPQQDFEITGSRDAAFGWSASADVSWLNITPTSGNGKNVTITVSVTTTNLSTGTHVGHLQISAIDAANSPETVLVSYVISPKSPHMCLSPGSFQFTAQEGASSSPTPLSLVISNCGGANLQWSLAATATWISVQPQSGQGDNSVIVVSVQPAGLLAGSYEGAIAINSPNADNSPQLVPVSLLVSARPCIRLGQKAFTFSALLNGSIPTPQGLQVSNCGGGVLEWSASDDTTWLSLSPTAGTGNEATLGVALTTTSLAPGTHRATITVNSTNASNSPQTATVQYDVIGPIIALDPLTMHFSALQNGPTNPTPDSAFFAISNVGGGNLNWSASDDATWLDIVPPTSGTGNSVTLKARVIRTDLPPGIYTATVTVSSVNASNSPMKLPVSYEIIGPHIVVSPTSLAFGPVQQNGPLPTSQHFTITNSAGGALTWSAPDNMDWLTVNPLSGSLSNKSIATVTTGVNTTALSPGIYTGLITVTGNSDNSPQTIQVNYTITPQPPVLDVDSTSIRFIAFHNGPAPVSKSFTISNLAGVGGMALNWSATPNQTWLDLAPASGSVAPGGNAAVTATVNTTSLNGGAYTAQITVSAPGATGSPKTITVTYIVSE